MIPAEFQQFIDQEIAAGKYPTADAVVLAGLRLLQRREEGFDELRRQIQLGLDELDRGEGVRFTEDGLKALGEKIKAGGRRRMSIAEEERGRLSDHSESPG